MLALLSDNKILFMGNELIQRKNSLRLSGFDYSQQGAYFVTIVTQDRRNLIGSIVEDELKFSIFGQIVFHEWKSLADKFPFIDLDSFIVMPNHLHGIIVLQDTIESKKTSDPSLSKTNGSPSKSLSSIIQNFKSISSRKIRASDRSCPGRIWEPSFHDRIIRNMEEYENIRSYIENNPSKWTDDENYK